MMNNKTASELEHGLADDEANLLESLNRLCSALERAAGIAAEAHFAKKCGSNDLARTRLNAIKTSLQDLPTDIEFLLSAMPTDLGETPTDTACPDHQPPSRAQCALEERMSTYTDLGGNRVTVEKLKWLENGRYWKPADPADDAMGEYLPCSHYCIGIDEDGDSISVWLNGDMQEVNA